MKRDVHGTPVKNRIKHFTGNRNVYTRKNLYRILEQQIESYDVLFLFICKRKISEEKNTLNWNSESLRTDMVTMEVHAFCARYVKHPKLRFMNIMACLGIFSIFYSRKIENIGEFCDFIQIFFNCFHRPSSSEPEKIRSIYYEAEYDGRMQDCQRYFNGCNISFLDLISNMVSIERRKLT